jgi:transcriptional regulator with XRE-family HTH domain
MGLGVGRFIREARERAGMSLRQLAAKVGVSAPFLSDLEHGRRGTERLDDIAAALGVSKHEVLERAEELQAEEMRWINANPEVLKMLRDLRRRDDYPGPRRSHPPRRRQRGGSRG